MSSVIVALPAADIWNAELLASHYYMTEMLVNAVHIVGRVGSERFLSLVRRGMTSSKGCAIRQSFSLINFSSSLISSSNSHYQLLNVFFSHKLHSKRSCSSVVM